MENNDEQLFPYMEYFDEDFPFTGRRNPDIEKLKLEWIDPHDIFVTTRQKSAWKPEKLEKILPDFCIGRLKSINIARIMGVNICWNGQHTIASLLCNGWEKVPCMVYECEDMNWRDNTVTYMHFSDRQRSELAFDLIKEIEEELIEEDGTGISSFEHLMEILEEKKQKHQNS